MLLQLLELFSLKFGLHYLFIMIKLYANFRSGSVPMVVYESEPSSIIAYALDSSDYRHALTEILRTCKGPEQNSSPLYKRKFVSNKENLFHGDAMQSGEFKRPSVLSFLRGNTPSPASPIEPEKNAIVTEASNTSNTATAGAIETDEEKKTIKQQPYIEVQFNDATTNFYCRIYFAAQFAGLRENVLPCGEEAFIRSLCRSVQWAARGGKSGSTFCKTRGKNVSCFQFCESSLSIKMNINV